VSDFLADREGGWMRERPEPTLRRPVFGVKVKGVRYILNKIVADAFGVKVNTIINWNNGHTRRPFGYAGPYPATTEDEARMLQDAELYKNREKIKKTLRTMMPDDQAAALKNLPRYAQLHYGLYVHGTGNRKR